MFRCDNCGGQQLPRTKMQHAVVERRDVDYKNEKGDILGKGWEIVKELALCGECHGLFV